jgi:hypothetical protein
MEKNERVLPRFTRREALEFVNGVNKKTTQIAFPESTSAAVYATGVDAAKGRTPTSNASLTIGVPA